MATMSLSIIPCNYDPQMRVRLSFMNAQSASKPFGPASTILITPMLLLSTMQTERHMLLFLQVQILTKHLIHVYDWTWKALLRAKRMLLGIELPRLRQQASR